MSDLEGASLYADVLRYQQKAATLASVFLPKVTSTERGENGMPRFEVGVVDAIVRWPMVFGSIPSVPYIEYQIALTRRLDLKTAVVGKRYSELAYFNEELHRRDIIRKLDAPSFPEKKIFCEDWWTMQTLEPSSKFVKERREEIHYYLKKLFIANPTIFSDMFVGEFFDLGTFDKMAAPQACLRSQLLEAGNEEGAGMLNTSNSAEDAGLQPSPVCPASGAPLGPAAGVGEAGAPFSSAGTEQGAFSSYPAAGAYPSYGTGSSGLVDV